MAKKKRISKKLKKTKRAITNKIEIVNKDPIKIDILNTSSANTVILDREHLNNENEISTQKSQKSISSRPFPLSKIFLVILLALIGYILFALTPAANFLIQILKKNLGNFFYLLLLSILEVGVICITLYQVIELIYSLSNRKFNPLVWKYFLGILFLVILGIPIIDSVWGIGSITNSIEYPLIEDSTHTLVGTINCTNSEKIVYITGEQVSCKTSMPELSNISYYIEFTFKNNSIPTKQDLQSLSFIAPPNLDYIYFRIQGIDTANVSRIFSVGNPYSFISKEEYNQKQKYFISYILALIGIIILTLPGAILDLKKLFENAA